MRKSTGIVLLALLIGGMVSSAGFCGVIRTDITVTTRPTMAGGWDLDAVISNTGNAEIHDLRAFIFVDDWTEVFTDLGDTPPGGVVRLSARHVPERGLPGRYSGMVRLHFHEKSGRPHRVFHPFSLEQGEGEAPAAGLDMEVHTPTFHPRAFWRPAPKIEVRLRNPRNGPMEAHVQVFLPEGITTASPCVMRTVDPGAALELRFPLRLAEPSIREARFHVTAWFEDGRVHASRRLEGRVNVEEGPVLLPVYALGAVLVLGVVFLVLLVRRKKPMLEKPVKG